MGLVSVVMIDTVSVRCSNATGMRHHLRWGILGHREGRGRERVVVGVGAGGTLQPLF